MDSKVYIYHLKEPSSDSFPYGQYFIDKETKKLYVSPIEKEKWEALVKRYTYLSHILTPIGVVAGMRYGERLSMFIASNSIWENVFLLLACIGILFVFFFYSKRKHLKRTSTLINEVGYQLILCEKSDERDYLEMVAKGHRREIVIFVSSLALICVIGYVIIAITPSVSTILTTVLIAVFLISAILFVAHSLVLKLNLSAISIIKARLNLLTGEE